MLKLMHITTVPHTLHFLIGQIGFMRRSGIDVQAVSSVDDKLDFFLSHEPIRHHEVTMERALSPFRDVVAMTRLWRLFRRERPTIVHAHTPKAGLLGMLAAFCAGVPVRVYHVHGLRFATLTGWKRQLVVCCERVACALATQVLCVSESARREAIDCGMVVPKKIKVLLRGSINGMDANERFRPERLPARERDTTRERLGLPGQATVIGFVGRLVKDKGIEDLAEAWKIVRKKHAHVHLLLVGDYEPQDPVSAATQQAFANDARVCRVDYDPDTPRLFQAMDLFCLPTYREGLPYVLLEASAMRLPIVATRVTGCVDAVMDGENGTLVAARDPAALAAAISRYLADPSLAQRHGDAGRRRVVRDFQPADMWAAVLRQYDIGLARAGLRREPPARTANRAA